MKRSVGKIISLILVAFLFLGAIPFNAYAAKTVADIEEQSNFFGSTGLNAVANSLTDSNSINNGYSIAYMEFDGNESIVKINNVESCKLVVAIYDEYTFKMIDSKTVTVEANAEEVTVVFEHSTMPSSFLAKAFLLDENNAALCDAYIDQKNTNAYDEFLSKEPEDFTGKDVIVFNEESGTATDFAVLSDDVINLESNNSVSFSYDSNKKQYTFKNATDEIKALKIGDVFYFKYGDATNEFLLFKVADVKVSGNVVVISEDEDIGLADAFYFIRVDEYGDYSEVQIDEENLGSAFTVESEPEIIVNGKDPEFNYDNSASFSSTLGLDWTLKESSNGVVSASISGSVGLKFKASVKLIYDVVLFGKDYYEFKSETTFELGLQEIKVEGKISLPKSVSNIPLTPIPVGPFTLTPAVRLIAEISLSLSFNITYKNTTTITADSANSLQKHQKSDSEWDVDVDDELEIKVGAGVELKLAIPGDFVNLVVGGDGGAKYTGNAELIGALVDKLHTCYACYYGDVKLFLEFDITLNVVIIKDVLDFKWNAVKLSADAVLFDFHISLDSNGLSCGKGKCDNYYQDVELKVVWFDSDNFKSIPVKNVTVSCAKGKFDAQGDKKYDDSSATTDANGIVHVYLPTGSHTLELVADGYKKTYETVYIYDEPISKSVSIVKDNEQEEDDDNNNVEDITGNSKWNYNSSTGILTITGSGAMDNYSGFGSAPWHSYSSNIQKIIISDGITSIGNYAFAQLGAVTSVVIPDSVKKIGMASFYGCSNLRAAELGANVTEVGDYAFYYCYKVNTLVLNDKLEKIGAYAYAQCTTLTTVEVPASVNSIGNGAFAYCSSLTSVTINNADCLIYNTVQTINETAKIYGLSGSTAQAYAKKFGRSFGVISFSNNNDELILNGSSDVLVLNSSSVDTYSIKQTSCVPGESYILINVTGWGNGFVLSSDNLFYINQVVADANGVVDVDFVPKKYNSNSTTLLIGNFGSGIAQKKLTPKKVVDMSECEVTIQTPSTTTINYGDTLILHAKLSLDEIEEGTNILWTAEGNGFKLEPAEDGMTCNVTSVQNGKVTVTATLVDADGNPVLDADGNEISASQELNSKVTFWQKIVSFFKNIFRIPRIILQSK